MQEQLYTKAKDLSSSSSLMPTFWMNLPKKSLQPAIFHHSNSLIIDSTLLCYWLESSVLWNTVFILLCFAVKRISNLSTDHWLMCFFRRNRCRIVGINIYRWNIYISQTLGNWSLDYIFNPSRGGKEINMRSVWFLWVICPFLYFIHRHLNMQFYSLSPHIHTANRPSTPNKHSHPECTVASSRRRPRSGAPCDGQKSW